MKCYCFVFLSKELKLYLSFGTYLQDFMEELILPQFLTLLYIRVDLHRDFTLSLRAFFITEL